MGVKIISGRLKNRIIETPASARPTLSRHRQSLFDMLSALDSDNLFFFNKRVIDCFAGSGALGLESLSRGASYAYLLDKDKNAYKTIKSNVHQLGVSSCCDVYHCDVFLLRHNKDDSCDIAFIDPPYGKVSISETIEYLYEKNWISNKTYIITEEDKRNSENLDYNYIVRRTLGDSLFHIFRLSNNHSMAFR